MKTDIVKQFLDAVPADVYDEVSFNIDIANHIAEMLKFRKMTQRELAARLGTKESVVSRWLTGARGFNTGTLFMIGRVLGEPVVTIGKPNTINVILPYSNAAVSTFKPAKTSSSRLDYSSFTYNNKTIRCYGKN